MSIFADDPAAFFGYDAMAVHRLPRDETQAHQLEALKARFSAMRDRITPLTALADAAKIEEIRALDDAPPLLFPHSL
jgi:hypothetical protein